MGLILRVNLRSFRAILGAHNLNKVEQTTITRSIIKAISVTKNNTLNSFLKLHWI